MQKNLAHACCALLSDIQEGGGIYYIFISILELSLERSFLTDNRFYMNLMTSSHQYAQTVRFKMWAGVEILLPFSLQMRGTFEKQFFQTSFPCVFSTIILNHRDDCLLTPIVGCPKGHSHPRD